MQMMIIGGSRSFSLATNVLRLCDGRHSRNLIINRDLQAAIAKPLLADGLSHNR
jgi:hypothetical protein